MREEKERGGPGGAAAAAAKFDPERSNALRLVTEADTGRSA